MMNAKARANAEKVAKSRCPATPNRSGGHALDVRTVAGVAGFDASDGSVVIEVYCKTCGQVGSMRLKPEDVGFDLDDEG